MNRFPVMAHAFAQVVIDFQEGKWSCDPNNKPLQACIGAVRRYQFKYPGAL